MLDRLRGWCQRHMPTRETFESSAVLRPIAHRILMPELWRFHRRSVPRGVALGLFVGIFIPLAQTIFAALLALPARANVPVAVVTTFLTNPFTTPPIWFAAFWLGRSILGGSDGESGAVAGHPTPETIGWMQWMLTQAGPATVLGLGIIAVVSAIVGYGVAAIGWRWWIGHKWALRLRARRDQA